MTRLLSWSVALPDRPPQCGLCARLRIQSVSRPPARHAHQQRQPVITTGSTAKDVQRVQEASQSDTERGRNGGSLLTWQQIDEEAGPSILEGYQLLDHSPHDGQPRTAPTTVLASDESTTTDKPVLLYRDTNAWCPFCERVCACMQSLLIVHACMHECRSQLWCACTDLHHCICMHS